MEKVTGYVGHIVFRNAENGYTVFHLENDDGEVTCVGNFNYITEGELLEITGEYVTHSVYGNQLKVMSHVVKEPEDLVSIERYLGSGAVKGIGAALAGRIVRKFKEDTFRIIEEEPERLAEIKGISERKAREISSQLEDKKDLRKAMIYLQKYGISAKLAAKIYNHYGMRVYKVMEENPYELADNIEGIGFRTADEIAAEMDISPDKVREIMKIAQEPVSLETPIGEEEDSHLGDFIQDDDAPAPQDAASHTLLKEQLSEVLDTLTPREEKVLRLRFGLEDGRSRTLEEVGKEFDVTRERIRQIEAKALRKLRHPSRSKKVKDFLD